MTENHNGGKHNKMYEDITEKYVNKARSHLITVENKHSAEETSECVIS